ncbi:spermatogenesis-associated protein 46 [Nomascus leucogenys]|uniref:spermatogenesis-associated protein 46 n=1 Tax=Nomascus leucogenys TaxID=61853 RepID=UPI00122D95E8|nr:spermatogenesis-associated protein 46 [Nomascus leucogenys]
MENFSLLSISGPPISSSTLSAFPDIMFSRATSLPDIAKTAVPTEASSPAQALPPQYQSITVRQGIQNTVLSPDCSLGDTQHGEKLRRNCTIYRPWFSPYSYFVCADKESQLEAYDFPEVQQDEGKWDNCLSEDMPKSICSSSSSPENTCPREATKKSRHGLDSITSQDILMASRWHPAQQNGYKCVACCRMYPTLDFLKSHIKRGFREGFSCKVYYRKLKGLWSKEQKARMGDRLSSGSCQAFNSPAEHLRQIGGEAYLCL